MTTPKFDLYSSPVTMFRIMDATGLVTRLEARSQAEADLLARRYGDECFAVVE